MAKACTALEEAARRRPSPAEGVGKWLASESESELFDRLAIDRVEPVEDTALADRPDEASCDDGRTTGAGRGLPLHAERRRRGAGLDRHDPGLAGHVGHRPNHGAPAVDIGAAEATQRGLLAADTAQVRLGQQVGGLRLPSLKDSAIGK